MASEPTPRSEELRAARAAVARAKRRRPGVARGRTQFRDVPDNTAADAESTTRALFREGSTRRLAGDDPSPSPQVRDQPAAYRLPKFLVAAWCPLDRGRVTARPVIAAGGWPPHQRLAVRRRASGVWLLAATDDVSAAARVDGSGRRIALDVEWLRANGLGRVTGFLVGATRQGVLLVDVRQAEFQKSGR